MKATKLYYFASPYTKYKDGREAAYKEVCKQSALLLKKGIMLYIPISHTWGPLKYGDLEDTHDFMLPWDKSIFDKCDGLIICMMDGWQDSYGVQQETFWAMQADIPIYYMTLGEVPNIAD